ncbi:peptide chain release factor 3 [Entomospira culicis]|uniref:Peptide chain release factor 3 n=1 Tax=Entomospira culicis TaxID=2719989 RepID=A0A968KZ72_9SPIO|nr:peptide chain release factor 3 [Entomospira culicis]NIZ18806.1 peptide chain release factor 3 [Entomospira culicis]NIZ69021.1 peptide chain release factor 3 [Entomospira culicis]WDI37611.1 peptide chain release factor 3 [Entomospira culicis]WDI39239.1 peptide chain release factor 3 [Entomospira culicis]
MSHLPRLTFAIISHPDAGKTTITEKLLLFGGAIQAAGLVKAKHGGRGTVSDFMQMEKERGVSISTSVMGFDFAGRKVNLLDTPGHADFSEDTYRTLTAVDSALMVIDSVKGVEERTRKLCEICRMRRTPIITFLNKLDREGKDPFEVLDEVERELNLQVTPLSWPIGQGQAFKGVYNLLEDNILLFDAHATDLEAKMIDGKDLDSAEVKGHIAEHLLTKLKEDLAMIRGVYPTLNQADYLKGTISPVLFGSALNNFGVRELLNALAKYAPSAGAFATEQRLIQPDEPTLSGFIFKIHANLDPKHRDRIAFMRICSGVFEKNKLYTHPRTGKTYRTATPLAFMAQSREATDKAYPGDIIGLHDTGLFRIGDAITEGERLDFKGIPAFSPQLFRRILNKDPLKSKQFNRALTELSEEGVIQVFTTYYSKERLIGAVGVLQFDVTQFRLTSEYGASCSFEGVDFNIACWVSSPNKEAWDRFFGFYENKIALDSKERFVFLATNRWTLERTMEDHPQIHFAFTSEG